MDFKFPFVTDGPFVGALLKTATGFPGCKSVKGFVVAVAPCPYCNDLFDDTQTAIVGSLSGDEGMLLAEVKSDVASFFSEWEEKNYQTISHMGAVGNHTSLNERVFAVKGFGDDEMNRAVALCYGAMQTLQPSVDAIRALRTLSVGETVSLSSDLIGQWLMEAISFLDQIPAGEGKILAEMIPTVANYCWMSLMGVE